LRAPASNKPGEGGLFALRAGPLTRFARLSSLSTLSRKGRGWRERRSTAIAPVWRWGTEKWIEAAALWQNVRVLTTFVFPPVR